jgi:hypothetical protein
MLYNVEIVYDDGRSITELVHSEKPLTIHPKRDGIRSSKSSIHKYEIEYHLPPTIFTSPTNGKKYLVPMWVEVHPDTTYDDVKWIKPKEKKVIEHIQGSMGEYKTTYDPNKNVYKCTCMGFWRSKGNCKHVKALKEKNLVTKNK